MFSSADKLIAPTVGDPTVESAQFLFIRVICQAVEDHGMPTWRAEVDAFFSGPVFARYCGLLGWNRDWAQRRIQRFVAGGGRPATQESGSSGGRSSGLDFSLTRPLAS
jgi:hypothetical protein